MKLMEDVGPQKLRGGFYTPPRVVDACWERIGELLNDRKGIRVLEPSAGDGAFLRGMSRLPPQCRLRECNITCVELLESEAAVCREELVRGNLAGQVIADSFFTWLLKERGTFEALVGNPPFIRYQFVPDAERAMAEWLLRMRGHELQGVSNYWIPFVLLGLDSLAPGGVFSLVLPSELLSTVSAGQVRAELISKFDSLRVDLYPRNTFPDILQDVLVLSGVRAATSARCRRVTFSEHSAGAAREWQHPIECNSDSWTKFLLSRDEWEAFEIVRNLQMFRPLKQLAAISVAIVTGANDFFTVDDTTIRKFNLAKWARPLLARTAESPGLMFTCADYAETSAAAKTCWLLDFGASKPDPRACEGAAEYLRRGEAKGLHNRFKCRIRDPWYRVPQIQKGALMMAKRSHQHHRLILNAADVFTTDTIYRGEMRLEYAGRERDLVAGFHNSITLLSAEIEGRTYGGGVLELVPSEIGRLVAPMIDTGDMIDSFDTVSRRTGGQRDADDTLIEATDAFLCKQNPRLTDMMETLRTARQRLRDRRFFG